MSAVVVGPHLERVGGEGVSAPRLARWFTWFASVYVIGLGGLTFLRANSVGAVLSAGEAAAALGMVVPAFCIAVAGLALVVRGASLRVDADGVRWGFAGFSFRMDRSRIEVVRIYKDAVAMVPRRGFAWYLSARDWQPFTRLTDGFERARLPVERHDRRAPLAARLQSYGPTLDVLLVLDIVAVTVVWTML